MPKHRLESFSDGVFAIVITLLILNIHLDRDQELTLQTLASLGPEMLAFALTFVIVGVYWVSHHSMMHMIKAVDRRLLWLNLLLLLAVVFIPFPAYLWPASVESACRGHLWIKLDGGERAWNAALVLREFASGPNLRQRISARDPLHRTTALGANCSLRRRRPAGSLAHNRKRRLVRGGHHNFWSAESFPGAAVGRTGTDVTAA